MISTRKLLCRISTKSFSVVNENPKQHDCKPQQYVKGWWHHPLLAWKQTKQKPRKKSGPWSREWFSCFKIDQSYNASSHPSQDFLWRRIWSTQEPKLKTFVNCSIYFSSWKRSLPWRQCWIWRWSSPEESIRLSNGAIGKYNTRAIMSPKDPSIPTRRAGGKSASCMKSFSVRSVPRYEMSRHCH